MTERRMTAKFDGRCRACQGEIHKGDEIVWTGSRSTYHAECYDDEAPPEPAEPDITDERDAQGRYLTRSQADAEYRRGQREAEDYLLNKKLFGEELADQWELERDLRDPEGW